MADFRLPISDISTHKSVNPHSLIINHYDGTTEYDGSEETTINIETVDHAIHSDVSDKVRLTSQTYYNVIGAANCSNAAAPLDFWFASIRPTSWQEHWRVKIRVYAQVPDQINCHGIYEFTIVGAQTTYRYYHNLNGRGSQYPIYYDVLYTLKEAGYNNGYGNLFGISLVNATNYNNQSWKRVITVEVLEADRCTVTLFDTPLLFANVAGTGTTNYSTRTAFDAVNQGLQETGDTNTREVNSYLTAGVSGLQRYSLIMQELSGKWSSIAYTTSPTTANMNTDATTRIASTGHYLADSVIMYSNTGSTRAPDSTSYDDRTPVATLDFRYSSNCKSTLAAYKPVYLIFNENSDGTITPRSDVWWTQDPLSTSYTDSIFIYIGNAYATTSVYLISTQPRYKIVNNVLVPYINANWLTGVASNLTVHEADSLSTTSTFTTDLTGNTTDQPLTQYNATQQNVNVGISGILPVSHGGTGLNTIAADSLVLGNDTGALKTVAKSSIKGAVLGITDGNAVNYQALAFSSYSDSTVGQTIGIKVGNTEVTTIDLDAASASQSGVVTTASQTFKGAKTFNDIVKLKADQYADTAGTGSLDLNNSDIFNVNSIKFKDLADAAAEGLQWYRSTTAVDSLWVKNGVMYFTPNRQWGKTATNYTILHTGNISPSWGTWTIPTDNTEPTIDLTVGSATATLDIPVASYTSSGVVNMTNQTFKGTKTFNGGMHIYGSINMAGTSATSVYSGGAYHGGHNSVVLHGDSAGVSGILFTSQLATDSETVTNVNSPTDRAFIQYHARGVTAVATDNAAPTLATSGEAGRLVIGVANDANSDMIIVQTGNNNDFRHLKIGSTNLYSIYDASNLSPAFGSWSAPTDNSYPEATLTFGAADSGGFKNRASVIIDLPVADDTHTGVINITNQSIKGQKNFLDGVHSPLFCVEDSSKAHKVQLEYNSTTKALDFNFV